MWSASRLSLGTNSIKTGLAPLPVCMSWNRGKNLLNKPAVEQRFLSHPALRLVTALAAPSWWHLFVLTVFLNENMRNGEEEHFFKKTVVLYLEALFSHPPGRTAENNICSIQGKSHLFSLTWELLKTQWFHCTLPASRRVCGFFFTIGLYLFAQLPQTCQFYLKPWRI
jgi:hypothetical protein